MRYTAQSLYEEVIEGFNASCAKGNAFGPDVRQYSNTLTVFAEWATILNGAAGAPDEDDFGPVSAPTVPSAPADYYEAMVRRLNPVAGVQKRFQGYFDPYDSATPGERYVVEKLYAMLQGDGL
jgi:hypothetical protein